MGSVCGSKSRPANKTTALVDDTLSPLCLDDEIVTMQEIEALLPHKPANLDDAVKAVPSLKHYDDEIVKSLINRLSRAGWTARGLGGQPA